MANKEAIRIWVDALMSGEYLQSTGGLGYQKIRQGEELVTTYCCLGVACALFAEQANTRISFSGGEMYVLAENEPAESNILPVAIADFLQTDVNPQVFVEEYDEWMNLTELNDTQRWSFPQIARAITTYYLDNDKEDNSVD